MSFNALDLSTPDYYPLRFDFQQKELRFVKIDPERYRALSFLDMRMLSDEEAVGVPFEQVLEAFGGKPYASPFLIMHMAFAGSTLLCRCLQAITDHMVLKEPFALTNLVDVFPGFSSHVPAAERPDEAEWRALYHALMALYGRRYSGQAAGPIIKTIDRSLHAVPALLGSAAAAPVRAVYLYLDWESFVLQCLKPDRLNWLQLSARHDVRKSRQDIYSRIDVESITAAQQASLVWLLRMNGARAAQETYGAQVFRAVHADALLDNPEGVLADICDFWGIAYHHEILAGIAESAVFQHHAKSPDFKYGSEQRLAFLKKARAEHQRELQKAADWLQEMTGNTYVTQMSVVD